MKEACVSNISSLSLKRTAYPCAIVQLPRNRGQTAAVFSNSSERGHGLYIFCEFWCKNYTFINLYTFL